MRKISLVFVAVAISTLAVGCGDMDTAKNVSTGVQGTDVGHEGHDGHDHAAVAHAAPHGGQLIELGRSHEFHAELLDDDQTGSIKIYILDSHLEPFSIGQSSISLVLTNGENTQTFELPASQAEGSSEFKSTDSTLMSMLDRDGTKGKLRVTINDQPFSGTFEHHAHDHD